MDRRERLRRLLVLPVTGILLINTFACVSAPSATVERPGGSLTDTPLAAGPMGVTFEVRREIPGVWAGASDPLPELDDDGFHALQVGHRVTTDANGEALLLGDLYDVPCKVYLFQSSRLVKRACSKLSSAIGNTSCLEEGSAVFNGCSGHLIMTPSSEIMVKGSWISVTYLPASRMTLLAVVEGEAEVQQVVTFDTGELGEPISVTRGQMLISLPDVRGGVPELPVAPLYPQPWLDPSELLRQPLPLLLLPLAAELLEVQGWMERVADRAEDDGVSLLGQEEADVGGGDEQEHLGEVIEIGEQDFQRVVIGSVLPVLVQFGGLSCPPCREMAPLLEEVAWLYAGELSVVRVDAGSDLRLASSYGIGKVPTLLFFQDGAVVDTLVGPQPPELIMERIERLLGGYVVTPEGGEPTPIVGLTTEQTETAQVLVELQGGALEDSLVQEAVAFGVDWDAIATDLFPGQQSPVLLDLGGTRINAQRFLFDTEQARKNLTEAGYSDGFDLVMEYPSEDETLARVANRVEAYLGRIGVGVIPTLLGQTFEEPGGEAPVVTLGEILMGTPTLRLSWVSR
jgi:thioredoxin 1